eukprot:CAMPEP_0185502042 /NCGR_PEP_ID=MMETSP1366-20130426/28072_1 /TAXON_ID=38817 /ORGANISM="Gephyrocapsa oceanica, Strain RCC1303" /LENGTH=73 /DNA_ID=CAMNT_0028111645 /DNA_START=60 /DNA_END=278 /DNA_ORIENTATION=+
MSESGSLYISAHGGAVAVLEAGAGLIVTLAAAANRLLALLHLRLLGKEDEVFSTARACFSSGGGGLGGAGIRG